VGLLGPLGVKGEARILEGDEVSVDGSKAYPLPVGHIGNSEAVGAGLDGADDPPLAGKLVPSHDPSLGRGNRVTDGWRNLTSAPCLGQ
jgi:hypothetical protein